LLTRHCHFYTLLNLLLDLSTFFTRTSLAQCPGHVQDMSETCPGHVRDMSTYIYTYISRHTPHTQTLSIPMDTA
jgi:hypothetical protein